jgi:hypothetical protein
MTVTIWFFVVALCCPFPSFEGDLAPTTIKVSKNSEKGCSKALGVLVKELQRNQLNFTITERCRPEEVPVAASGQSEQR